MKIMLEKETEDNPADEAWRILRVLYGDGVPLFVVLFAVFVASQADTINGFLRLLYRDKPKPTVFTTVFDNKEWIDFYYSHRLLLNGMFGIDSESDGRVTDVTDLLRNFRYFDKETQQALVSEFTSEFEKDAELFCKLLIGVPFPPPLELVAVCVEALDLEDETESLESFEEFVGRASGRYFISVWFPCWFLHQTYPAKLLRKARRGCLDSFEKILRIDKAVLTDPVLRNRWTEIQMGDDSVLRRKFERAFNGTPKIRIHEKYVRHRITGLVSKVCEAFGTPVSASKIGRVFDLVAEVRGQDHDEFIAWAENLTREVNRHRAWPSLS